jgi:hypothetical protein
MKKNIIFAGLVLVMILAAGCAKEEKNDEPKIIGGDKDEGGCLIGAGYSWCEAKQKCIRVWEENCTEPSTSEPSEKACKEDALICPDGVTTVSRNASLDCQFDVCPQVKFCLRDTKTCADGSTVGRVSPDCEFAACP